MFDVSENRSKLVRNLILRHAELMDCDQDDYVVSLKGASNDKKHPKMYFNLIILR